MRQPEEEGKLSQLLFKDVLEEGSGSTSVSDCKYVESICKWQ